MLTQLEVYTPGITVPPWPIVDQNISLDPIQIKKVTGLGPVTASVNTTPFGSIDGESLDGTHTPKRNIVITAALNPDWSSGQTYEGLRQLLYGYFMPERKIRLRFTSTHLAPVEIVGYVESCDPDLFSKDPEYQISILCPLPYFIAIDATVVTGLTTDFAGATDTLIDYEGSVETGFVVDFTLATGGTAFTGEVRIMDKTPTTKLLIASPVTVSSTQFFRMSSVQGDKYIRRYPLPSGVYTSLLGSLVTGSEWPSLRHGVNTMQILSSVAGLHFAISYYARYGGL